MTGPTISHPAHSDWLARVMAELVAVRVPFSYEPTTEVWHRITVARHNWPVLERIIAKAALG